LGIICKRAQPNKKSKKKNKTKPAEKNSAGLPSGQYLKNAEIPEACKPLKIAKILTWQ
jgi:hypothetical protein